MIVKLVSVNTAHTLERKIESLPGLIKKSLYNVNKLKRLTLFIGTAPSIYRHGLEIWLPKETCVCLQSTDLSCLFTPAILKKIDIGKMTADDHFVGTGRYDWKISESKRRDRSTRRSLEFVAHNAATREAPTYATLMNTSKSLFVHL